MTITEKPTPAPKPEKQDHLRVLANGAVYDMRKKRITANPGGGTTAITPETASEFHAKAQARKRERLMAAANAVAMQGGGVDGRELTGDLAFVEAIGEAMTMKALTVNDPKAVDAARFIFTETGISERQSAPDGPNPADDPVRAVGVLMLEYIRTMQRAQEQDEPLTIPALLHDTNRAEKD